jgi:lipopolysaccharide transport system permease protein
LSPTAPPVTVIEPRRGWRAFDARELWRYRELLYFLAWRDVKVAYKQTFFGAAWAVFKPVVSMLVFRLLFGRALGLDQKIGGLPYPVFVFAGQLPWNLFSQSLAGAGHSVVESGHILTKIYFPRLLIPIAAIGSYLIDFAIAFLVLLGLMLFYGIAPGANWWLLPALLLLTVTASLAVGIGLSALMVAYRDVRHAIPFLTQMWFFLTPVVFPVAVLPPEWRWLLALNPLAGVIDGFRHALLGQPLDGRLLLVGAAVAIAGLLASILYFRRVEAAFADIV